TSHNPIASFSAEGSGFPGEKKTSGTTGTGSGCTLYAAPPATGDRSFNQTSRGPRYDSYLDVGRRKTDVPTANRGNIAGETGLTGRFCLRYKTVNIINTTCKPLNNTILIERARGTSPKTLQQPVPVITKQGANSSKFLQT